MLFQKETLLSKLDSIKTFSNIRKLTTFWKEAYDINTYLVGGVLRDFFLLEGDSQPNDLDFCVIAHDTKNLYHFLYEERLYTNMFLILKTKDRYGSSLGNCAFSIARKETFNREKNIHDNQPAFDIWNDIMRRDFVMNTLYLDMSSFEIIDKLGAIEDIKKREINNIYSETFMVDPSRIIRFYRYLYLFNMSCSQNTLDSIEEAEKVWSIKMLNNDASDYIKRRIGTEIKRSVLGNCGSTFNEKIEKFIAKVGFKGKLEEVILSATFKRFFLVQ